MAWGARRGEDGFRCDGNSLPKYKFAHKEQLYDATISKVVILKQPSLPLAQSLKLYISAANFYIATFAEENMRVRVFLLFCYVEDEIYIGKITRFELHRSFSMTLAIKLDSLSVIFKCKEEGEKVVTPALSFTELFYFQLPWLKLKCYANILYKVDSKYATKNGRETYHLVHMGSKYFIGCGSSNSNNVANEGKFFDESCFLFGIKIWFFFTIFLFALFFFIGWG